MQSRIRDLKCKEVINICDGCRLGYVDDVEVRVPEGQMLMLRKHRKVHKAEVSNH